MYVLQPYYLPLYTFRLVINIWTMPIRQGPTIISRLNCFRSLASNQFLIHHGIASQGLVNNLCECVQPASLAGGRQFAQGCFLLEINMSLGQ